MGWTRSAVAYCYHYLTNSCSVWRVCVLTQIMIDPATADLMWSLHLCVIVPNLLFISFLAYQKKFYNLVMVLLGLSPVIAMMCHAYVASQMENYLSYLSEGYLCIF